MNRMLELKEKRERLWNDAKEFLNTRRRSDWSLSSEDENIYRNMLEGVYALGDAIDLLREQAGIDREIDRPDVPGIKPYYLAAWQRIGDLAEAIERQCWSGDGDTKPVQKFAAEIGWQCSMIESLKGAEDG